MLKNLIEKVDLLSANLEKVAASLAASPPASGRSFASLLKDQRNAPGSSFSSLLKEHTVRRAIERADATDREPVVARPTPLCRDFASKRGCTRGSCKYLHQVPECKDFKRGKCTRGLLCRFLHLPLTATLPQTQAQVQTLTQPQPQLQSQHRPQLLPLQPPGLHPEPCLATAAASTATLGPAHLILAAAPAATALPSVSASSTATQASPVSGALPSSRRGSTAKRRLPAALELEEGELPNDGSVSNNPEPKHRRLSTSTPVVPVRLAFPCLQKCGFTTCSTDEMCCHMNVAHTDVLPPAGDPHGLATFVNAVLVGMRCPDGHSALFCDGCRAFHADSGSAAAAHEAACQFNALLAQTGVDPASPLPPSAAGLLLEQLTVTSTELEGATLFALPDHPTLIRHDMGSVVEVDGKTEAQFCFPLSVLRSRPVGVAAVGSLPPGCSVAERLMATRTALAPHAVALRNDLVVRANAIAAETSDHPVDFATSGSGADVEMLYACAMITCPLIVVSQQGPGRFSATRISHPSRPATPESPTALLFCVMKPASGEKPASYHFQALIPAQQPAVLSPPVCHVSE